MMKNYNFLNWHCMTRPTNQQNAVVGKNPTAAQSCLNGLRKTALFLSLFAIVFLTQEISAQASFYSFAQSNGSYTAITGGTVVTTSTNGVPNLDSYVSPAITIPSFTFAGVAYTTLFVTGNGALSLGATAPSASTYTVLSSTSGGNVFLAPLSADLDDNDGVSEIRYETIGNEFVVQWKNFRRYARIESVNFQVRMDITTGVVKFVYDGTPPYDASTVYQPQVGIKSAVGSSNALTVSASGNWNSPVNLTSGVAASSLATFAGNVGPTSGLTYTWTPGVATVPNCASSFAPANLATNVERNPTLTWTEGGAAPTSYDIYFGSTANPSFLVNQVGTSYKPAILAANTTYYWKIVPKNAIGDAIGCIERSFTTGSNVTYCIPSSTGGATYINNFSTSLGSTNISNASGYTVGGYQDNYTSTAVSSIPTGSFNFAMTVTGGTLGAAIWVDWNSNGTFETTERVFATTTYADGPFTGSITVPAGTPIGDYRMRVMVDYNTSVPSNPCNTTGARTETEDYKITVGAQNACSGTPAAATIASSLATVCVSGSVDLTAIIPSSTDSGFTYQWYNTAGAIAGATSSTFSTPILSAPESYFFKTTCTGSGLSADSNTITIGISNPQVISTTPSSRCGEGTVTLSATASAGANLSWYDTATGGVAIGTGSTFTTPNISTTTDFYVAASQGEGFISVGPASPTAQGGTIGSQTTAWNINFTVNQTTQLTSVDVFPNTAGMTSAIALRTATGTVITTVNFTTTVGGGATAQTVLLNFPLTPGNYQLYPTLPTGGVNRNISGAVYPYSSSVASITGNGYDPLYFMGMYNWKFSSDCFSARTAVTATIDTAPALTLSSTSSAICAGTATNAITLVTGASNYDTFVWSPSTSVTGDAATGFIFNPTATTTYTLTASQSAGSLCTIQVPYTVNVNEVPSPVIISPATASICSNEIQALTSTGGIIGTSGSTTIGLGTTLTSQTDAETAFNNRFKHYWMQMVFTKAELNASGFEAGSINGIKFNITTLGDANSVSDYRVHMGATTSTVLTGFTTAGLTEVFTAATYSHTVGVNSITFNTPYVWDGISNIIVDIRSTGADALYNAQTYYTATTDNKTVRAISSSSFASSNAFAASNPTATTSLKRLNTTFDWDSSLATATTWLPVTNLFTDAAATVAYVSGTAAATVYVKSPTSGSQTYTATATATASGCSVSEAVTVTVNEAPSATITRADDTLTAGLANATYQWIMCDASSTPIAGATNQDYTATVTGSYAVMVTLNGCTATSDCFEITTLSNNKFDFAKLGYYPNPVNDVLTVTHTEIISNIRVYDITGRLVRQMNPNNNEVQVDMTNMPASIYIVKVSMENTSGEFKVIKK